MRIFTSLAVFFSLIAGCTAQIDRCKDRATIAQSIRNWDEDAIRCAARSGDKRFVPDLDARYRIWKKRSKHGNVSALQLALAILGDSHALNELLCEVNHGPSDIRGPAFIRLGDLGGWLAFSQLSQFLEDRPEYVHSSGYESDEIFQSLQAQAIHVFVGMRQDGPGDVTAMQLIDGKTLGKATEWKNWITAHELDLSTLSPGSEVPIPSQQQCVGILRHDPVVRLYHSKTSVTSSDLR